MRLSIMYLTRLCLCYLSYQYAYQYMADHAGSIKLDLGPEEKQTRKQWPQRF